MSLHKSITVNILKKFSADELNSLQRFIIFSTDEKNKTLITAYNFLHKCAPDYDEKNCNKENFSKKVFNKKLNEKLDKEINRLMSELKDELEKYMVYKFSTEEQNITHHAHFMWYHSKGLIDEEQKVLFSIERDLTKINNFDNRDLYILYLELKLAHAMTLDDTAACYFLFLHYHKFLQKKFEIDFNLLSTGLENIRLITSKKSETELKQITKNSFIELDFSEEVDFFKALNQFIHNQTLELYLYLKGKLVEGKLLISNKDKAKALTILNNKVSRVYVNFEKEALDLMSMKFEVSKLLRNGGAIHYILDDYIEALINNGMIKKARTVLSENKNNIVGLKDKNNFYNIYDALILEKERNFENALQIANICYAETKDQRIFISALKVRLAYELKQSKLLTSYVNNLRKYLSSDGKKEHSDRIIKYVLAFVSNILKLSKISSKEKSKLLELKKEIENNPIITRKKYILEKIEEKLQEK